jgi:phage shock protein PspC (stress-responsive transcriptional regulator)
MRKVTTINLNNNAYQIDEDGYEALRQYLQDAEHALAGNPDLAEIMADLEQAIADKCRATLGQYKTVVSTAEIEGILKDMGPVVSSTGEGAATSGAGASAPGGAATGTAPRARRLYRINEGKMITGVCTGLAAYAGVDVTWVRIAFALLTIFTGGFWLVAYLVLFFVMPVADTPEELAAANGQPFNAQELVDRVKQKHQEFRAERRAKRHARRHDHWFAAQPAGVPQHPPGPAARIAGSVMLPVFTVISAGWFVAMALAAFVVWHTYQHTGFHWQDDHWSVADLPRWIPLLAVIAVYVLLALPISAGRRAALFYANGGRAHGWASAWSGVLWIALVAVLLAVAWTLLPQLREVLQNVFGWPEHALTTRWT